MDPSKPVNPYATSGSAGTFGGQSLDRVERQVLTFYVRHRAGLGYGTQIAAYLPTWIILISFLALPVFALGIVTADAELSPYACGIGCGIAIGILFRDVVHMHANRKVWPLLMRVLDFRLVERMLSADSTDVSPDEPLQAIPVDEAPTEK